MSDLITSWLVEASSVRVMRKRAKEYLRRVSSRFWKGVDGVVTWATNTETEGYPPLFIVGPARSGTTLAYQCMVAGLNVSYITNIMNRVPFAPVLGWKLSRFYSLHSYKFKSKFGKTSGMASPAQGIPVWTRWFPRNEGRLLAERDKSSLYNYVALVQGVSQMPFINKWQGHNEHIDQISDVFPDACYIYVTRNTADTVYSLNKAWRELVGDPDVPFSRPTPSYELLKGGDILCNSCAYVVAAKHDLEEWMGRIDRDRVINIGYNELCNNPEVCVKRVAGWYERLFGINICDYMGIDRMPKSFEMSRYGGGLEGVEDRIENMAGRLKEGGLNA